MLENEKQYQMLYDLIETFPTVYPVTLVEQYMSDLWTDDDNYELFLIILGDNCYWNGKRWFVF